MDDNSSAFSRRWMIDRIPKPRVPFRFTPLCPGLLSCWACSPLPPSRRRCTLRLYELSYVLHTAPLFHLMGPTHGQHTFLPLTGAKKSPVRKIFFANWRYKCPLLTALKPIARRQKMRYASCVCSSFPFRKTFPTETITAATKSSKIAKELKEATYEAVI